MVRNGIPMRRSVTFLQVWSNGWMDQGQMVAHLSNCWTVVQYVFTCSAIV